MRAHMVIKRVVLFGVVWLVSAVVMVGVLTVAAGVSEADTSPPDPPGDPGGRHYRRVQAARHSTCCRPWGAATWVDL